MVVMVRSHVDRADIVKRLMVETMLIEINVAVIRRHERRRERVLYCLHEMMEHAYLERGFGRGGNAENGGKGH